MLYIYAYVLLLDTPTQERREGGGVARATAPGPAITIRSESYR